MIMSIPRCLATPIYREQKGRVNRSSRARLSCGGAHLAVESTKVDAYHCHSIATVLVVKRGVWMRMWWEGCGGRARWLGRGRVVLITSAALFTRSNFGDGAAFGRSTKFDHLPHLSPNTHNTRQSREATPFPSMLYRRMHGAQSWRICLRKLAKSE